MGALRKAGGNWVEGDRFFDREAEIEALAERVREGVRRGLDREVRQRESLAGETPADPPLVEDVLHVLEHDGYLARQGDGYRFVSGLLEDWWRVRYGRSGASSASPGAGPARSARR